MARTDEDETLNFKKIEMYGFKSFADKLEIKFENGITGIVGPNGCGKSNVADSIRWVLGEQSAKTLRGNNMLDVIFSGTAARKSLSYCEVSLFFDNSNHEIPLDYTDIIITRKLYRSGESEYSINRTPCRLKDIVELLRDIGVGKEGYSIIGQGKVDEIINSKPEDRRGIFEDACGISKFKARKVETERKLARTHDNLLRLHDIIVELERQLRPLEKQSEAARKFLEFKEELKYHELNQYISKYDSVGAVKAQIQAKLDAVNEEYARKENDFIQASDRYNSVMEEISRTDERIGSLRDRQLQLSLSIEKQSGEIKLIRERIGFIRENMERTLAELSSCRDQLEQDGQRAEQLSAEYEAKKLDVRELSRQLEQLEDRRLSIVELMTRGESDTESSEREMVDKMERLSEIKANLSGLTAEKKALCEQQQALREQLEQLERERAEILETVGELGRRQEAISAEREAISAERDKLTGAFAEAEKRVSDSRGELAALSSEYSAMQAKEKLLSRIQENFEGYQISVKMLLTEGKRNPEISRRICGTVAHLMRVPKRVEIAIDVALGQAMQNIVVETEADAKYLIGVLKEKRYGRVTFLPVETVKGRYLDDGFVRLASSCEGYVGVASDLVEFDSKYRNIYVGQLGRTVIVDTLDHATAVARKVSYAVRIVTLEGDVIHPFGAMTGGSRKAEASNLLSGERELAEIRKSLDAFPGRKETLERKIAELSAEKQTLEERRRGAEESVHAKELELAACREKLEQAQSHLSEKESEYERVAGRNYEISGRLDAVESDLKLVDELERGVSAEKENASSESDKRREEYRRLVAEGNRLRDEVSEVKLRQAEASARIAAIEQELGALSSRREELSGRADRLTADAESNREAIAELERQAENTVVDCAEQGELNEVRAQLEQLDEQKRSRQTLLAELDFTRQDLSKQLSNLSDSKYREENNLVKVDTDMEVMQTRIAEDYNLDYEGALAFRDESYDVMQSVSEINRLKKQISGLGYVNVSAIEDYKELKVRYDEMDTQRNDLEAAEDDLKKIISELTVEMLDRFTRGFNEISANFQRVFKELFGGGSAKLVLTDSEDGDPLRAGVDIIAQPPGKKLQSITLLSGGEKALTAIAILFAILKMRPMPFCVLDEIEAALDDANTERLANYLKKFSEATQFIVITHKKPTMEKADALYGVTMEEKGVSKMVSVKLSEASKMVDTAS